MAEAFITRRGGGSLTIAKTIEVKGSGGLTLVVPELIGKASFYVRVKSSNFYSDEDGIFYSILYINGTVIVMTSTDEISDFSSSPDKYLKFYSETGTLSFEPPQSNTFGMFSGRATYCVDIFE